MVNWVWIELNFLSKSVFLYNRIDESYVCWMLFFVDVSCKFVVCCNDIYCLWSIVFVKGVFGLICFSSVLIFLLCSVILFCFIGSCFVFNVEILLIVFRLDIDLVLLNNYEVLIFYFEIVFERYVFINVRKCGWYFDIFIIVIGIVR